MKNFVIPEILLILLPLFLFSMEDFEDRTLSPYFFVKSEDPEVDSLPLKSTEVSVKIAGVIADVKVKQVYENEGKKPLEAIYIFPASTKAAVYGMKMKIGERIILAKIKEREEAREIYQKAKNEGRTASLLEEQRPNVFQMNVSNIMPEDKIEVELKYTEILIPQDKIYEFVYPAVVGPRYSNIKESEAPPSEKWIKSPYFHEKEKPGYKFNIEVLISAGLPVYEISSPSHEIDVNFLSLKSVKVNLTENERYGGNRDFILRYKLSGKKIEDGILLYENGKEKFFLLMLQPPERIKSSQIPEREYIFIVDVSGSMYGFPIEISKKVLKEILKSLKKEDKFNILLFSGSSYIFSEKSVNATKENIKRAIDLIENQKGGGGTELLPALKRALSLPRDENLSTTIIVLTDGYVTVEKEAFEIIRNNLNKANLFAFGIGKSVNRFLIEGMARAGMAESFILTRPEEAEFYVKKFKELVSFPVLTDIKLEFNGFEVYDVEPPSIPDLFIEKPVLIFGKYKGNPDGTIEIKGISGEGTFKKIINVYEEKPSKTNSALPYLWARYRISTLSDYADLSHEREYKEEIINLGLKYNLLTKYTSFIAEDTVKRNKEGKIETIKQPLPLPEGVSDYAIGEKELFQYLNAKPLQDLVAPALMELKKEEKKGEVSYKINVRILKLKAGDNIEEKTIKNFLEKSLKEIENCKSEGKLGKINLKIILDEDKRVERIEFLTYSKERNFERCLKEKLKALNFNSLNLKTTREILLEVEFYV